MQNVKISVKNQDSNNSSKKLSPSPQFTDQSGVLAQNTD